MEKTFSSLSYLNLSHVLRLISHRQARKTLPARIRVVPSKVRSIYRGREKSLTDRHHKADWLYFFSFSVLVFLSQRICLSESNEWKIQSFCADLVFSLFRGLKMIEMFARGLSTRNQLNTNGSSLLEVAP